MSAVEKQRLKQIFNGFADKTIAVIGDVMLDRYFWGDVSRVSPEAPVPVIDMERESFHLGGAANVASNLNSLGVNSILCGIIGEDNSGKKFKDICTGNGIDPSGLYVDIKRPTTVKTRIIGNNQQIVRLDREVRSHISQAGERHILNILKNADKLSGIIFGDYDKGAVSSNLIKEVIELSREMDIPVFVDPKYRHFFEYKGITVFKPNRKEAAMSVKRELKSEEDITKAGEELMKRLDCEYLLLTLGKNGMMLFDKNRDTFKVDTKARSVSDVSGAGDTVIAALASCYAGGATMQESAAIANVAAGYVCGEPGIVSVTQGNIWSYLK